jgi:hypothetical protein
MGSEQRSEEMADQRPAADRDSMVYLEFSVAVAASGERVIGTSGQRRTGQYWQPRADRSGSAWCVLLFYYFILGLSPRSVGSRQVLPGVGGVRELRAARDGRLLGAEA